MNEQTETTEQPIEQPVQANDVRPAAPSPRPVRVRRSLRRRDVATCGGAEGLPA